MEKNLKTFQGLHEGEKIKVVRNTNSHNYPMDVVLTLKKDGRSETMDDAVVELCGNTLSAIDCTLGIITVKNMEEELVKLERECDCLKAKIQSCKELGLTEYDETYCKVYSVLGVLKDTKSDIEKTKIITDIIKSCK